jgi:AmiR/NasT family two-component response regulator
MATTALNKEEKGLVAAYRSFPLTLRRKLKKEIDKMKEALEDAEDIKDARKAMQEKSIPAEEVYQQLGI